MKKSKLMKKILGLALATATLAGTFTSAPAMANNYADTNFNFTMSNKMVYTSARSKTDTSKLYMNCTYMSTPNASYSAHAIGTNSTKKVGTDCSRGRVYYFTAGSSYYMTSWVKENGYKYARIGASPNYSYSFKASGKWSPDNYNKY